MGAATASIVLAVFLFFNQAGFIGLFFLISGCFSAASFDRKGVRLFLQDRFSRLGIPLLAYMLVLGPLASLGATRWHHH